MASSLWNTERIEDLRRLWGSGFSASEIAHDLGSGFTRNGVLGKIFRLGLQRHHPRPPPKPTPKPRAHRVREPKMQEPKASPIPIARRPRDEAAAPMMRRLPLVGLLDHHCRWPIGDPHRRGFYFCGANRHPGSVYCSYHTSMAFASTRG